MIHVYILQSKKDFGYYIGISKNVQKRIKLHNSGSVKSTKHRIPFELKYYENFESYNSARIRELQIKSYKGGNSFKKLISG